MIGAPAQVGQHSGCAVRSQSHQPWAARRAVRPMRVVLVAGLDRPPAGDAARGSGGRGGDRGSPATADAADDQALGAQLVDGLDDGLGADAPAGGEGVHAGQRLARAPGRPGRSASRSSAARRT